MGKDALVKFFSNYFFVLHVGETVYVIDKEGIIHSKEFGELEHLPIPDDLKNRAEQLREALEKKYHWVTIWVWKDGVESLVSYFKHH